MLKASSLSDANGTPTSAPRKMRRCLGSIGKWSLLVVPLSGSHLSNEGGKFWVIHLRRSARMLNNFGADYRPNETP